MRKPRHQQLASQALYHLVARPVLPLPPALQDPILRVVQTILDQAGQRFDFALHRFWLEDGRFHFCLQPQGQTCLSTLMKWILQVTAGRINRLLGRSGRFWAERFRSQIVENPTPVPARGWKTAG